MVKKYIVCWCVQKYCVTKKDGSDGKTRHRDYYECFVDGSSKENLEASQAKYKKVVESGAYSANICEIITSTDY